MVTVYGLVSETEPQKIRYVGITRRNPAYRLNSHKYDAVNYPNKNKKTKWISENECRIKLIVLDIIDNEDEAFFWEEHWISLIKSWGFKLTNSNNGGGGISKRDVNFSEWLSKRNIGNKYNLGKHHTHETRKKISNARKGKPSPRKGAILSDETKLKQSLAKIGKRGNAKGFKHTESTKNKKRKIILQLTQNNELIREWPALTIVAEKLKLNISAISNACRGITKTCGGFKWKYK